MDLVQSLSESSFDKIIKGDKPVLVDFWAAWCGPCKMISPIVEEIAHDMQDKLIVGKVNVDESSSLASKFGVMSIPTLVIFKEGKEVERLIGYHTKDELAGKINKII